MCNNYNSIESGSSSYCRVAFTEAVGEKEGAERGHAHLCFSIPTFIQECVRAGLIFF